MLSLVLFIGPCVSGNGEFPHGCSATDTTARPRHFRRIRCLWQHCPGSEGRHEPFPLPAPSLVGGGPHLHRVPEGRCDGGETHQRRVLSRQGRGSGSRQRPIGRALSGRARFGAGEQRVRVRPLRPVGQKGWQRRLLALQHLHRPGYDLRRRARRHRRGDGEDAALPPEAGAAAPRLRGPLGSNHARRQASRRPTARRQLAVGTTCRAIASK